MAAARYLAMTQTEFANFLPSDDNIGWLGCRLSPWGTGVDRLPPSLPPGSLLIMTDEIPFQDHDPARISAELHQVLGSMNCTGLLLDYQQPRNASLAELARQLTSAMPCPVIVSEAYAVTANAPVFLSPCPHHIHLRDHIAPWAGREIWLDLARDAETITLTREGSFPSPLPPGEVPKDGHCDRKLHCHYRAEVAENIARFILWRTKEDLYALVQEAESLGIQKFVGLHQELQDIQHPL